jgi:hypothetical protein
MYRVGAWTYDQSVLSRGQLPSPSESVRARRHCPCRDLKIVHQVLLDTKLLTIKVLVQLRGIYPYSPPLCQSSLCPQSRRPRGGMTHVVARISAMTSSFSNSRLCVPGLDSNDVSPSLVVL